MSRIKKVIFIALAAVMAFTVGGCGKKEADKKSAVVGDGVDVVKSVETIEPDASQTTQNDETAASLGTGAAQAPFVDSYAVNYVDTDTMEVSEDRDDFEEKPEKNGYRKYISGDKKWGIQLPEQAVPGDEDESGIIFTIGPNMIAVNTIDEVHEFTSPEEAKQYFAMLDEVKVNNFTVVYDDDDRNEYAGCYFDFQTSVGAWGFCKYSVDGRKAASAVAVNMSDDASLNDLLRDTVNSLVVLD